MTFDQFAAAHGLIIRNLVRGKITRCPTEDHPRKNNGAFYFDTDFGWVMNWAEHIEPIYWKDQTPRSEEQRKAIQGRIDASRKKAVKERAIAQRRAAEKAAWILEQCELDQHAYLDSKGFPDMRCNVWRKPDCDPLLVVPMYCGDVLCGCQLIDISGRKKFLTGQRTNGAYFKIGQTGREIICEGYATALSIHALMTAAKIPATIYAAFSVGNASRLAKTHPRAFWIADHDVSGVGQKAAAESGLHWWMPPHPGTDANDRHKELGLFAAMMELRKVLNAKKY